MLLLQAATPPYNCSLISSQNHYNKARHRITCFTLWSEWDASTTFCDEDLKDLSNSLPRHKEKWNLSYQLRRTGNPSHSHTACSTRPEQFTDFYPLPKHFLRLHTLLKTLSLISLDFFKASFTLRLTLLFFTGI